MRRLASVLLAIGLTAACETTTVPLDGSRGADAAHATDAATAIDAGTRVDSALRADAGPPSYGTPVPIGTTPSELPEISGIVASRTYPGTFWVENDSGNPAEIFAVDETGSILATIRVSDAPNVDWEDLTILASDSGGDAIYIADTGNNAARETDGEEGRTSIPLYRLAEPDPALGDQTLTAERIELMYPDRPYDCEAVFADHTTGDIYLVTKEATPAEIFVARAPHEPGAPVVLEHAGQIDFGFATAADMARDGAYVVVRGYDTVRVFPSLAGGPAATLASPAYLDVMPASSAEAICFGAGYDLFTIAEGTGATLFRIPAD
jgi:hypothetical protein